MGYRRSALVGFGVVVVGLVAGVGSALAVAPAPSLRVTDIAFPTVLPMGQAEAKYVVVLENVGAKGTEGEITLRDVMPPGLTASQAFVEPSGGGSCVPSLGGGEVSCSLPEAIAPSGFVAISIYFTVGGVTPGEHLVNSVSAGGGGAPPVSGEASTRVGAENETAGVGFSRFGFEVTGPAGEPVAQAGGHPTFLTTTVLFNNLDAEKSAQGFQFREPFKPIEPPKDLVFYLPLGLLGDATVPSECPQSLVEVGFDESGCPPSSRIGTVLPMILSNVLAPTGDPTHEFGLYNMVPEKGYPAEFAFASSNYTFVSYVSVVRHDGQYVLRISIPGVPAIAGLTGLIATFDGDISEKFVDEGEERTFDHGAYLTDPTDCGEGAGAREASVAEDTWVHPDPELPIKESAQAFSAIEDCQGLRFGASLGVTPETTQADEPSGYQIGLEVPQGSNEAISPGTPPIKSVQVTLPAGTTISPSAAHGLRACPETGPGGIDIEGAGSEAYGPSGLVRPVAGHCPHASQLGTVTATSPDLHEGLTGHLYLATPRCGGSGQPACTPADAADGSLFGVYLELEAPNAGVIVKLQGKTLVDPATGQARVVFDDAPQFPVSDLVVSLNRGARAPLANAQSCKTASSQALVEPWSAPTTPVATSDSTFNVDWDGQGGACPAGMPFAPAFIADTQDPVAGAFSPFSLTLKREDREQDISSISTILPQGLLAMVSRVTQCPEPQAAQGACSENSLVGSATAGIGSGSEPFFQTGRVYLTGPYDGAPFGLSIVVPAVAGPFNLGNVIVRVALHIDPSTAQVTGQTPPAGTPGGLPLMLDGVPLRLRTVNLTLNRQGFTLNPTSCAQRQIVGTVTSTQGASVSVVSPFAVSGCQALPFKPSLTASTQAKVGKASGASLTVKVTSSTGQANIGRVDLRLPKSLPARLSTLQQACTEAQFAENPAECPVGSDIGTAKAVTPILNSPLTGPAYLVSHGGAAFPDVEFILQGEGVTIVLDGQTQIKQGITYSHFDTVPDAPISSFETVLPEGPHSALTIPLSSTKPKTSLCGEKLVMPTTLVGQNGARIDQSTNIAITGCAKARALTRAQRLARALRSCRKRYGHSARRRKMCERAARKRYGAHAATRSNHRKRA